MSDDLRVAHGNDRLEPLDVPRFAAGTFTVQGNGTEVLLILQNARPLVNRTDGAFPEIALEAMAFVSISPATAKDLCIALRQFVDSHERAVGPLTTPFTQQSAEPARALRGTADVTLDQFRHAWQME